MHKCQFNLKNPNAQKRTAVNMLFNYNNQRLKMSTGISVPPKFWNSRTQRVREHLDFKEYKKVNGQLEALHKVSHDVFNRYPEFQPPSPEQFKQAIENELALLSGKPIAQEKGFWDYFEAFIHYQEGKISARTLIDYNSALRKHLQALEKQTGYTLSLDSFKNREGGVSDHWHKYLHHIAFNSKGERGLSTNTIGKQNKCLRTFFNWCFDRGVIDRFSLSHLPAVQEEVFNVYLSEEELNRLETTVLTDEELSRARNLFLIGCETGLRFSDLNSISPDMITDRKLRKYQKKTRQPVVIPVSDRFERILEKYKGKLPKYYQVSEFNKLVREACKQSGINQKVRKLRKRGTESIEETWEKWELVSSHTCRRSFCTNKYLKGMPAQTLMKFSGHKTERALLRYLKIDGEKAADLAKEYF